MKNLDDVALAIVTLQESAETDFEIALVKKFVKELLSDKEDTRICPVCGKQFYTNRSDKKYCSDKCRKKAENMRYKKTAICKNCGKEFVSPKYINRQFCSQKCSKEYRFHKA